jgi:antitoxin CptB
MDELAKLRWQCRRGTKELDLMLNRYLETRYLVADQAEREIFVALLELGDDKLASVLLGDTEEGEMGFLVNKIRHICVR